MFDCVCCLYWVIFCIVYKSIIWDYILDCMQEEVARLESLGYDQDNEED